jgi:hypothetical protein
MIVDAKPKVLKLWRLFLNSQSLTQSHNVNPTQEYDLNPQISQREIGENH